MTVPPDIPHQRRQTRWRTLFFITFGALLIVTAMNLFCPLRGPDTAPTPVTPGAPATLIDPVATTPSPTAPQAAPEKARPDAYALSFLLATSFYNTFADNEEVARLTEETGIRKLAERLSAHVARNLVWNLDMRKEVYPGDELDLVFRVIPPEEQAKRADTPDEIELLAMRYRSVKLAKEFRIYRFKASDRQFPAYYNADGTAVEKALKRSPLKDWIQITSLLKDRRPKHDGIDFKAPVGTPIYAPWSGIVEKTNWKTRYNGYSLLARLDTSPAVQMILLHLDKVHLKPGQRFAAGDHLADVGNTGRSFAPHLHYQLQYEARKIIDPLKYHGTVTAKLPAGDAEAFRKTIQEFDGRWGR
ncbi:MAG TPA: M23 family metallopeptidase [bacterium]|nr:M23 family metallopeptidase [bacterium]